MKKLLLVLCGGWAAGFGRAAEPAAELRSVFVRAVLAEDATQQIEIAEKVSAQLLTVRETEALVRKLGTRAEVTTRARAPLDPNVEAAEERLTRTLGTKVRIVAGRKKGTCKIEIDYFSEDELDRLFSLLVTRSH